MSAIKTIPSLRPNGGRQRGIAAIELALVMIFLLPLLFGTIELARAMYICNVLQEVTRRAAAQAAVTDFSDGAAMQRIREYAVLRDSPGLLAFADPVTDAHVRIDYMWIKKVGSAMALAPIPAGSLPASPEANHVNCLHNAYSESCIRMVRVQVCRPDGAATCTPVPYRPLVALVRLSFNLPESTTLATAETLGLSGGVPPEPCGCT
jgi:hypothetical protein